MAPKKDASAKDGNGAASIFTAREQEILINAFLCMNTKPEVSFFPITTFICPRGVPFGPAS